jgi:hypothetical protein
MFFLKKGRGALWVCIWHQGGGGPKKFGHRWAKPTQAAFKLDAAQNIQIRFHDCYCQQSLWTRTMRAKSKIYTYIRKNV